MTTRPLPADGPRPVAIEGSTTPRDVAAELERLAAETGNAAFRRAARALFQEIPAGRPPIDDRAAIAEALSLLESGAEITPAAAFRRVAKAVGGNNVKATAKRLKKKFRAMKKSGSKIFRASAKRALCRSPTGEV